MDGVEQSNITWIESPVRSNLSSTLMQKCQCLLFPSSKPVRESGIVKVHLDVVYAKPEQEKTRRSVW